VKQYVRFAPDHNVLEMGIEKNEATILFWTMGILELRLMSVV
jgi:hypothetical protein